MLIFCKFHIILQINMIVMKAFWRQSLLSGFNIHIYILAVFSVVGPSLDHHHRFAWQHGGLSIGAVVLLREGCVLIRIILSVVSTILRFLASVGGHIWRILSWLELSFGIIWIVPILIEVFFLHPVLSLWHPVDYRDVRHRLVLCVEGSVDGLLLRNRVFWRSS